MRSSICYPAQRRKTSGTSRTDTGWLGVLAPLNHRRSSSDRPRPAERTRIRGGSGRPITRRAPLFEQPGYVPGDRPQAGRPP